MQHWTVFSKAAIFRSLSGTERNVSALVPLQWVLDLLPRRKVVTLQFHFRLQEVDKAGTNVMNEDCGDLAKKR